MRTGRSSSASAGDLKSNVACSPTRRRRRCEVAGFHMPRRLSSRATVPDGNRRGMSICDGGIARVVSWASRRARCDASRSASPSRRGTARRPARKRRSAHEGCAFSEPPRGALSMVRQWCWGRHRRILHPRFTEAVGFCGRTPRQPLMITQRSLPRRRQVSFSSRPHHEGRRARRSPW